VRRRSLFVNFGMTQIRTITSKDNSQYRYVRSLHDRKNAEREGVVFLEGVRLCEDALCSGLDPVMVLFSSEKEALAANWCKRFSFSDKVQLLSMPPELFARLGSTKNSQGAAIVVQSPLCLGEIPAKGNDLYLVCEETSDPGNLGTMIRMADAFDFTAVLLTAGSVDPFNEKAIRASMGSCFHIPILFFNTIEEICIQLRDSGVQMIASHLKGMSLPAAEYTFPCAIFIGNEARGLTDTCTDLCDLLVKIPMPGKAESLNASSAASILGYEISSQRQK
jgi:RNA methyltransferase, TrmH family